MSSKFTAASGPVQAEVDNGGRLVHLALRSDNELGPVAILEAAQEAVIAAQKVAKDWQSEVEAWYCGETEKADYRADQGIIQLRTALSGVVGDRQLARGTAGRGNG
jgi:hypothetical protein